MAIEPDVRGDYGGKVVEWLMGAVAAGRSARIGSQITNGNGDAPAGALDADVLALISGPHSAPTTHVVEWEGTRYRVDPASGETARLRLLGDSPAISLSSAASLMAGAHVLESPRSRAPR